MGGCHVLFIINTIHNYNGLLVFCTECEARAVNHLHLLASTVQYWLYRFPIKTFV